MHNGMYVLLGGADSKIYDIVKLFLKHLKIYLNDALVLCVLSMSKLSVGRLADHFPDRNGHLC